MSRSYICRLVKDGRIILINGKVDRKQADDVLDETWCPRRKDNTFRKLIAEALHCFAHFAGENGFDEDRVAKLVEKFIKCDQFNKKLKNFGHPGLDSYEVELKGEWAPVDIKKFL